MAKGDLKKVLEELNTKLEKDSEAYRTLVANKQAHYLVLDQEKLKKQIQNQLEAVEKKADSRFSELSIGFKQIIEREVPKMFDYLAAGNIVIASKLNVYSHVLKNNSNSFLVSCKNINNWKMMINKVFNSSQNFMSIKLNAINTAKKYSWDNRAKKYYNFIKN